MTFEERFCSLVKCGQISLNCSDARKLYNDCKIWSVQELYKENYCGWLKATNPDESPYFSSEEYICIHWLEEQKIQDTVAIGWTNNRKELNYVKYHEFKNITFHKVNVRFVDE